MRWHRLELPSEDDTRRFRVNTKVVVEPTTANRERWRWSVRVKLVERPGSGMFVPYEAWEQARAVEREFGGRFAAEQLRWKMRRETEVPR